MGLIKTFITFHNNILKIKRRVFCSDSSIIWLIIIQCAWMSVLKSRCFSLQCCRGNKCRVADPDQGSDPDPVLEMMSGPNPVLNYGRIRF